MITKNTKIYIAGHRGMVGSAVWRVLESKGYSNLIGKTSAELNLRNQKSVLDFYNHEKPEVVIDAAAKVGGILANNDFPYQFLMENMQIQNNLIDGAHIAGIDKFIFSRLPPVVTCYLVVVIFQVFMLLKTSYLTILFYYTTCFFWFPNLAP